MKSPLFKMCPLAVAMAAASMLPWQANANSDISASVEVVESQETSPSPQGQSSRFYIVQLDSQPLNAFKVQAAGKTSGNNLELDSKQAIAHSDKLAKERTAFSQALASKIPSAKTERHFDTIFNGVVVESNEDIFSDLKQLTGVKRVFHNEVVEEYTDASHDFINTTEVWQALGGQKDAGKGVRIAVIDSGINPEHPMFDDAGFEAPTDLPGDDYCRTTEPDFCNNKLIVARFAMPTNADTNENEHLSPMHFSDHGTHVAATAAGNPVSISYAGKEVDISGVAPGAYVMAYKGLFARSTGRSSGSSVMLLEMLDWAVKDGADIINNSWGGSSGSHPENSVYPVVFDEIEKSGVLLVSAAGNSGPDAQSIGCPGCSESGLTVANTMMNRFFSKTVELNGSSYLAQEGSNNQLNADVTLPVVAAVQVEESNVEGCEPFSESFFTDSTALISRGGCSFTQKAENATAAGASALVVYNNRPGYPTTMTITTDMPAVMVRQSDGLAMLDGLAAEAEITLRSRLETVEVAEFGNATNTSSSRGPNGDHDVLKPDIAAPGTHILSAAATPGETTEEYGHKSGTSMASPHVAGAAALLKQMYPEWSVTDLKTALTSSALFTGLKKSDGIGTATPFDVGAGLLDISKATQVGVTFDKPSFAKDPCLYSCSFTRTMHSKAENSVEWVASINFDDAAISANVTPQTLTLDEGGQSNFQLHVDTASGELDTWYFGRITWSDTSGNYPEATMPIAVFFSENQDETLLTMEPVTAVSTDGTAEIRAQVSNKLGLFSNQIYVTATAPDDTQLIVGSEAAEVALGSEILLDLNEGANTVGWTGALLKPSMSVSASTFQDVSLADPTVGGIPLNCSGECDNTFFTLTLPEGRSFKYNGDEYTQMRASADGVVVPGSGGLSNISSNSPLPNQILSNNIIAPFWTNFHLGGENSSGSGQLYQQIVEFNGRDYQVIEWNKAQLAGAQLGREYTFQVWVALDGDEEIFFNYLDIDLPLPESLSVGGENILGNIGVTYHLNGQGIAPSSNSQLQLVTQPQSGELTLSYAIKAGFGVEDSVSTLIDSPIVIDVLSNDELSFGKQVLFSVEHDDETFESGMIQQFEFGSAFDLASLTVLTEPVHGSVAIVEGKIEYTPAAGFEGRDSLTYQASTVEGNTTVPVKVSIKVERPEPTPTMTPSPAPAMDNDGDSGGGSVSWFLALIAPLMFIRRRKASSTSLH